LSIALRIKFCPKLKKNSLSENFLSENFQAETGLRENRFLTEKLKQRAAGPAAVAGSGFERHAVTAKQGVLFACEGQRAVFLMVYLHNTTDCVVRQKIGLILSMKTVLYDTFRCCTTQFFIISVG
jgi:hypothetical protein